MRLKLLAGLISLVSVIVVSFSIIKIEGLNTQNIEVIAKQGILDLTKCDLEKGKNIKLDGEWEFYDGKLLNNLQLQSDTYNQEKKIVKVPMMWNKYDLNREKPEAFGYGTYHLRVLLGEDANGIFGIKTTNIGMSNKIMINGKFIGESGAPASEAKSYEMGNVPYVSYFQIDTNSLDIFVWVSNYDYSTSGGIVNSIFFGTEKGISKAREISIANEVIVSASLVTIGAMFFVLFIYRRKEKYLFYFSMFNITGAIYILSHGEKLLYQIMPSMDYALFARVQYLSPAVNILMFLMYLYCSFKEFLIVRFTKLLIGLALLFIPIGIFAPLKLQSICSNYQMVFFQFVMIYSVYVFTFGILNGIRDSIYLAIGSLATLFIAIIAVQNILGQIQFGFALMYAQIVLILAHSFLIAARLSRTYAEIEALSKELVVLDKTKDEFLAKTSHEFKTPLHGIINIIKLYVEQGKKHIPKDQLQSLTLVIDIANRLSKLVNDILDMSKIREGKLRIDFDNINVNKQLQDVISICRFIYEEKGNELLYEASEELLLIRADKDRFNQIMYNLIDNAMTNTNKGKIIIKARGLEGNVEISVQDTGIGIHKDKMEKIFEPFTQLSEDINNNRSGAGLGLSIVKELMELQEGSIKLDSEIDKGSCFTVIFPKITGEVILKNSTDNYLTKDESKVEKVHDFNMSTPFISNPEGESTIIIADDNFSNLKILADVLSADNYRIIAVKNGEEALNQIKQQENIDLAILDVMMTGMSGYQVCEKIREHFNLSELPILMLTAAVNVSGVDVALKIGANDFLNKPFQLSELRARVNTLVMMKKSAGLKSSYEVAFLHAQIKPHFLYNALNTIAESCETDSPETGRLIISLSKYLRGTLDFANLGKLVSVDKELALVKAYLDIEKARFEDLSIVLDIDEEINVQLPPMTLQILVENAVKHGVIKKEDGGTIKISIKHVPQGIFFTVQDDGVGMSKEQVEKLFKAPEDGGSIGLYNINLRLERLYGKGIYFYSNLGEGTKVSFLIPEGRGK